LQLESRVPLVHVIQIAVQSIKIIA